MPNWRTLLSSVLIVLAFSPWGISPLIWVCLIPWFMAIDRAPTKKAAFKEGLWLSFLMSVLAFYWVASVLREFAGLPWPLAILGLVGYGLIGQPQFTLFAPLRKLLIEEHDAALGRDDSRTFSTGWKISLLFALLLAFLYTGIDWLVPKLFVDTLGHALYQAKHLRQVADIGGAALLTWVIYLVNDALYCLWKRIGNRGEPSAWPAIQESLPQLLLAGGVVLGSYLYGEMRIRQMSRLLSETQERKQIAVIQANIGDFDKVAAERGVRGAATKVLGTYYQMSDEALAETPRPEVLVWPETSYPSTFRTPGTNEEFARDQYLEKFVQERKISLLFGGYDHKKGKDFNAFFFLQPKPGAPQENELQVYQKNILLLFGEYIPGAEQIRFLREAFPQVGNFGRGAGPSVLKVKDFATGPIICYEALFPNYVIEAVRKGSQLILNITNDSWFGPYGEPELHLSLTVFRSIETRVPQLRATNTGISALILPDGTISERTPVFEPRIMNVSVPLIPRVQTLMLLWGDWFGVTSLILGVLLSVFLFTRWRSPQLR